MGRMRTRDVTYTQRRDLALYVYYINLLHERGEVARFTDKADIYEEAAEVFFVSPESAGRIIRKQVKHICTANIPADKRQDFEEIICKVRKILDDIKGKNKSGNTGE